MPQRDNGGRNILNIKERIAGKAVVLGMGNPLRGDDGLGPAVVSRLKQCGFSAAAIDGGLAPENCAGQITRIGPDVVVMVDAVRMGEEPGTVRVLELEDLAEFGWTTHDAPLSLWARLLGCDVLVLAAEPKSTGFGEQLSAEVRRASDKIVGSLMEVLER